VCWFLTEKKINVWLIPRNIDIADDALAARKTISQFASAYGSRALFPSLLASLGEQG